MSSRLIKENLTFYFKLWPSLENYFYLIGQFRLFYGLLAFKLE